MKIPFAERRIPYTTFDLLMIANKHTLPEKPVARVYTSTPHPRIIGYTTCRDCGKNLRNEQFNKYASGKLKKMCRECESESDN